MTSSHFLVRWSLVVGALTVVAGGSGCGGDGGDTSGGGGTGGSTEPKYQPFAEPTQTWIHGDPTALEQELLELVQRARANPQGEVDLLLAVPGVKSAMAQYNVKEQQLRDDFANYQAVAPLSFDTHLMDSSRFHSQDMATVGFQEHDGSAGESFDQRIDKAGYKWAFLSENIFAYAESVPYCHAGFMVDWGNAEPGHRNAILDIDGPKRDIGISVIKDPSSTKVGPLVVTEDFGAPAESPPNAQKYIVGVAYDDKNGNGAYDAGEGLEGLHIVPSAGDYAAITSKSGGFSVPMSAKAGLIQVQIQDTSTFVLDQKEVTLDGENVKLDFVFPVKS